VVAPAEVGGVLAVDVVGAGGAVLGWAVPGWEVHDAASRMTSRYFAKGVLRLRLMVDKAIIP
jgi:hypothetical protein